MVFLFYYKKTIEKRYKNMIRKTLTATSIMLLLSSTQCYASDLVACLDNDSFYNQYEENLNVPCFPIQSAFNQLAEEIKKKKIETQIQQENARISNENNRKNNVHYDCDNIQSLSGITLDELNQVFIEIGQPQMCNYSNTFIECEKQYKINSLFMAALVANESGWTFKPAGNGTNLTGYDVVTSTSIGKQFDSRDENILCTAELLRNQYLSENGRYYNGSDIWSVNYFYCRNPDKSVNYRWSSEINKIAYKFSYIYHNKIKKLETLLE